jgi:hypothetical protein
MGVTISFSAQMDTCDVCMYVCMYSRFAVQQWNDDSGQTLHHAEALGRGREQRNQQVRMLNSPCVVVFSIRVGI